MLPREEWDFRSRPKNAEKKGDWTCGIQFDFLPDDEVWNCWRYEFTRKSSEVDYCLKWRASADKPKDFSSLLAHYWCADPNRKEGTAPIADWFYSIWPEWPRQPFLSVRRNERERRYKQCWGDQPKRQLHQVHLRNSYRFVVALKAGEETKLPPKSHLRVQLGVSPYY